MRYYPSIFEALKDKLGIAVPAESAPTVTTEIAPDLLGDALRAKVGADVTVDETPAPVTDIGQGARGSAPAPAQTPQQAIADALDAHLGMGDLRRHHPFGDGGGAWRQL